MSDSKVTTLDDAPVVTAAAPVAPKNKATHKAAPADVASDEADEDTPLDETFYNVTIHETGDQGGTDIVEVGVNGYLTRIPRGVPCRVSGAVLHVLQNAVTTSSIRNGDKVIERNIPRFPFTATPAV